MVTFLCFYNNRNIERVKRSAGETSRDGSNRKSTPAPLVRKIVEPPNHAAVQWLFASFRCPLPHPSARVRAKACKPSRPEWQAKNQLQTALSESIVAS